MAEHREKMLSLLFTPTGGEILPPSCVSVPPLFVCGCAQKNIVNNTLVVMLVEMSESMRD